LGLLAPAVVRGGGARGSGRGAEEEAEPAGEEEAEEAEEVASWPWAKKPTPEFHGRITERYRIRTTSEESDQDLRSVLNLEVKNLYKDQLDLSLDVGFFWDLWGRQDSRYGGEVFYFEDFFDSYETKIQGRVYGLELSWEEVVEGLDVSFGRQQLHKGEPLHFDGLRLSYSPSPVFEVTLAGGLPVYYGETQWVSNFEAAGYVEFFPGYGLKGYPDRATKLTLEYVHVQEGDPELSDDYMSFQVWQRFFGGASTVYLKGGFLNGQTRDVTASLHCRCPFTGVELRMRYMASPTTWGEIEAGEREDLTVDMAPFTALTGAYYPFRQFDVSAYKQFCPYFGASLAYTGRDPVRDRYETSFNHDFDRYAGTAYVYDVMDADLDVSLTAELYGSDGPVEDQTNVTWGFDMTWRPSEAVRVTAGSHFLKYRIVREPDRDTRLTERYNVRVMRVGIEVRPLPTLRVGVRYEMESDEGAWVDETSDTLEVRASFQF